MTRRQSRGLKAVKAVKAAAPEAAELDELDEMTLEAIRRTFDRAEALDADLAKERAADNPSPNRIALLASEARLAETQGEKWGRDLIKAANAVLAEAQKNPDKVRAARVRWAKEATGGPLPGPPAPGDGVRGGPGPEDHSRRRPTLTGQGGAGTAGDVSARLRRCDPGAHGGAGAGGRSP